jgi:hypothetical protein
VLKATGRTVDGYGIGRLDQVLEKYEDRSNERGRQLRRPLFVGNLCRSAHSWRSQPLIDLSGNIYLACLPQKLVATNAKGHAFSLFAQVDCLLR